ncbi:MAG: hypothetical protein ACE5J9_04440 [Methanosarcinales archaeon]
MIFDETDEYQKLLVSVNQLRRINGSESLEAMANMIDAALSLCISSIKYENPGISDKELIKNLKKIYSMQI